MIYAIETFDSDDAAVNEEIWIPYEGSVSRILYMENGKELPFEKKERGYVVKLPEYCGEKAPLGRVFCLK